MMTRDDVIMMDDDDVLCSTSTPWVLTLLHLSGAAELLLEISMVDAATSDKASSVLMFCLVFVFCFLFFRIIYLLRSSCFKSWT